MSELDNIIKKEYDAVSQLEIMHSGVGDKVLDILKDKLSHKGFLEIEDDMLDSIVSMEFSAFQQGFIRGVAITKGGVL